MTDLRVAHASMQFSDSEASHEHDARAIFDYAKSKQVVFLTGTEASTSRRNHDLHDFLTRYAKLNGYRINAHKYGDWVAVNTALASFVEEGYAGPFVSGTSGKSAAHGGHLPRGIAWLTAKVPGIGTVTQGSAHFMTQNSIDRGGTGGNGPLLDGIASWGRNKGKGRSIVFFNADVNSNDQRNDVFQGRPFTTVWDELGKWPGTHGSEARGGTIDVSASYDVDARVSAKSATVLDDSELRLATDHFMLLATYQVTSTPPSKRSKP